MKKKIRKLRLTKLTKIEKKIFIKILDKLGYKSLKKSNYNTDRPLIKAFQRRFRQSLINGIADQECLIISKNLLNF